MLDINLHRAYSTTHNSTKLSKSRKFSEGEVREYSDGSVYKKVGGKIVYLYSQVPSKKSVQILSDRTRREDEAMLSRFQVQAGNLYSEIVDTLEKYSLQKNILDRTRVQDNIDVTKTRRYHQVQGLKKKADRLISELSILEKDIEALKEQLG